MSCFDANWLFAGDPHGDFDAVNEMAALTEAPMTVLLGDFGLEEIPLDEALAPAMESSEVYWIYGNHDTRSEEAFDAVFSSGLAERNLHGQVTTIRGVRVAGLGGHFRSRVWYPPDGKPNVKTRRQFVADMGKGNYWRGGVPRKVYAVIWPEDYRALRRQKADVLITHEAPSCHPKGFAAIDHLARAMGARLIVHGHTHLSYRFDAADGNLTVLGVGYRGVTNGLGEVLVRGELDAIKADELFAGPADGRPRPAGRLEVPAVNRVEEIS